MIRREDGIYQCIRYTGYNLLDVFIFVNGCLNKSNESQWDDWIKFSRCDAHITKRETFLPGYEGERVPLKVGDYVVKDYAGVSRVLNESYFK